MSELREKVEELERAEELPDRIEKAIEILRMLRKNASTRKEKYEAETSNAYWTGIFDALGTTIKLLEKVKNEQNK